MSDRNPKGFWEELRRALLGWMEEEEEEAGDPALLFHMFFTVPLIIGLLAMVKRL